MSCCVRSLAWICNTCFRVARRDRQAYQSVDNPCHCCTTNANTLLDKALQTRCHKNIACHYSPLSMNTTNFLYPIGPHFFVMVGIFVATCGIVKYFCGALCPHYNLFGVNASCVFTVVSSSDWKQQCLHTVSAAHSQHSFRLGFDTTCS